METPHSGIYWGRIIHHRFSPKRHYFTYPVFMFSVDLDEVGELHRKLRLFSLNRFSLYSLHDKDHGSLRQAGRSPLAIKENMISLLRERGYSGPVDKIFMITQFRALGYLFNPVTFYYCYAHGRAVAYIAEVNNTFHQRYSYVFPVETEGQHAFRTDKIFYVSPFVEMEVVYEYRFQPLGNRLGVYIDDYSAAAPDQVVLKTHIVGDWEPLTDWNLLKSFLRIPFMSLWIIAWIHWQALKLWWKKIPVVFRPHSGMKPGWEQG